MEDSSKSSNVDGGKFAKLVESSREAVGANRKMEEDRKVKEARERAREEAQQQRYEEAQKAAKTMRAKRLHQELERSTRLVQSHKGVKYDESDEE